MSIKVIQGFVRQEVEQKQPAQSRVSNDSNSPAAQLKTASQARTVSSDAVVTTLRAFRAQGVAEPIKDIKEAEKVAKDVSERVREDKEENGEAKSAHGGLSSSESAPVLSN